GRPRVTCGCPSRLRTLPRVVRNGSLFVYFRMAALTLSPTKTFPLPSTAIPVGQGKLHFVTNAPVFVNFWTRQLGPLSVTKTFPVPSTATASGLVNCPSPLPRLPHLVRKVPAFVNFWTRWLLLSATKTFPIASTVRIKGLLICELLNCPSPLPALPHFVTN